MEEKKQELKELRKIPKKQLTEEQKKRIRELVKEIAIAILNTIINLLKLKRK